MRSCYSSNPKFNFKGSKRPVFSRQHTEKHGHKTIMTHKTQAHMQTMNIRYRSLYSARTGTIEGNTRTVAATGTIPHTATTGFPVFTKQFHRHLEWTTGTTQSAL